MAEFLGTWLHWYSCIDWWNKSISYLQQSKTCNFLGFSRMVITLGLMQSDISIFTTTTKFLAFISQIFFSVCYSFEARISAVIQSDSCNSLCDAGRLKGCKTGINVYGRLPNLLAGLVGLIVACGWFSRGWPGKDIFHLQFQYTNVANIHCLFFHFKSLQQAILANAFARNDREKVMATTSRVLQVRVSSLLIYFTCIQS